MEDNRAKERNLSKLASTLVGGLGFTGDRKTV